MCARAGRCGRFWRPPFHFGHRSVAAGVAVATEDQIERLKTVVPYAQATMRKWHVPASVSLSQWIFESGWGADKIAVEINNVFGIKWTQANRTEPYREYQTTEYAPGSNVAHIESQDFVRYPSVAACFEAHGKLLGGSVIYLKATAVSEDVPAYCRALQSCGYSTNPRYAKMLLDEIAAQDLEQYDNLPPLQMPQQAVTT